MKVAEIEKAIREKRIEIDVLIVQSKQMVQSDCTADAIKQVRRAYSWLGKCLQSLNTPNPYPESTNKNSKVIEKRTDTVAKVESLSEYTPLAVVKEFRSRLDGFENWAKRAFPVHPNAKFSMAIHEVEVSLVDAKMLFEWELERIKNLPKAQQTKLATEKLGK